ncbi:MAG: hypothetical protein HY863_15450 [Chloroflexi bacterium]|nr:hypothetical protein [Chloroflexota bacterium]
MFPADDILDFINHEYLAFAKSGKFLMNPIIRPLFIGYEMAQAWLKHNVEEVGNFEFFLSELYKKFNEQKTRMDHECSNL